MSPWVAAMEDYTTAMRAAGRAPGTVRLHRYRVASLAETYRDPWAVTTGDLHRVLSVEHWAPETRKSVRSSLRSFYAWAFEAGHIEEDPAARLRAVKVPAAVPRPAPEDVLRAALAAADPRMGLMLRLAAYAGLRRAEIAQVKGSDLVGDVLRVEGKGGKTREVPLVDELVRELTGLDGWAFPNGYGSHMTPGHVGKLMAAALPAGWTAHTLRHRFGTTAYDGTRDLLAVGALLGHSRPETTQRYVKMPDDALRAAIRHVESRAPGGRRPGPVPPALPSDVQAGDVERCYDALEAGLEAGCPWTEGNVREIYRDVAERVAAASGRPGDVEHFALIVRGLVSGVMSRSPELVECRTRTCSQARVSGLDYAGTTCTGCGRPRSRVLGPVSEPDCPPWCEAHPVESVEYLTHSRTLVERPGLLVTLDQSCVYGDGDGLIIEPPFVNVAGEDDPGIVAATPEVVSELSAALAQVSRLLPGV